MKVNRMLWAALFACLFSLIPCATIFAVDGESSLLKSGMKEVSFMASISTSDVEDYDVDQTTLLASVGYFFTEQHEVGVNFGYSYLGVDDNDLSTTLFHLFYSYNIPITQPSMIPYVGLQLGFGANEIVGADAEVTSFGIYGGLKYFLTPSVEIFVQPSYLIQEWDADNGEDFDVKRLGIDSGIAILF